MIVNAMMLVPDLSERDQDQEFGREKEKGLGP